MDLTRLVFTGSDHPTTHSLAEMVLWPPSQGTIAEVVPLELDLDFDGEEINTPELDFVVKLKRADIYVTLENCSVVRGSRFGVEIQDPYVLAEITEKVRTALATEVDASGKLDISLSRSFFGRLVASIRRTRRRVREEDTEHLAKMSVKVNRIIARPKNRWTIVEPRYPHILSGRYLGERYNGAEGEKTAPLFLFTIKKYPAKVRILLTAGRSDLSIRRKDLSEIRHRNVEVILEQMIARAIPPAQLNLHGTQPGSTHKSVCLCFSELECENED